MKRYIYGTAMAVLFLTVLASCAGNSDNGRKVIGVDELASVVEDMQDGDTLSVRGFCVDVCGHGGEHITLVGEDSTHAVSAVAEPQLASFSDDLKYQYVTVNGVLREQKVDEAFLDNWEYRLDESLKGPNGNPEAVAMLKGQIVELRDSIAARFARTGKKYWSSYTIEVFSYEADR
ncbi:MAG: hypothetical protein NC308_06130 [Clostridium sp.]|nr:hypothetical protein [Bacteroides sp.]MCM1198448.1 hypothetical protein [Clostridium sp.]